MNPGSFVDALMKKGPAQRTLSALAAPLAPWLPDGVFVFHQGRCGSTVLAHMLDQHPRIAAFGEIFETAYKRQRLPAPAAAMLRARRLQAYPARAVVEAKFFEGQHLSFISGGGEVPLDLLRRAGYRRFIVLDRKNYLRVVLSSALAVTRGKKFHYAASETVPETKVALNPDVVGIPGKQGPMLEVFAHMDRQYARLRADLDGEDVLELTYEDDIQDDPHRAYRKVCAWLGLDAAPAAATLRRSNTRSTCEVIENWDEIAATLAGTPYAWMPD